MFVSSKVYDTAGQFQLRKITFKMTRNNAKIKRIISILEGT